MGIERAVVQFVSEGVPEVEASGDRVVTVNANVEKSAASADKAAVSAKSAADEASKSAHELGSEIKHTLHLLHLAARAAESLASAAGVEADSGLGEGIDVAGGGISGAVHGARIGSAVGGPFGTAIGTLIGATAGINEKVNEIHAKAREREEREKEAGRQQKDHEIVDAMLRQLGLAKVDATFGGARRVE